MSAEREAVTPPTQAGAQFTTTHWSVVLAAGDRHSPQATDALERLCRAYWYPLYAYIRRYGFGMEDAQDLTQEFLLHLLERGSVATVAREKGRFRSFLLAALKYFLANERDRARTQKRGGDLRRIDWDALTAEQRYALEPAGPPDAHKLYDRRWAMTLLDRVVNRMEEEHRTAGKEQLFAELHGCLLGDTESLPYEPVAQRLRMSPGAVKTAVHRMRRRFQELIRSEIAQTVATPSEVEDELRSLCGVIASG
jgi:RNA polymerase sigma-70 factor (ECF subfamily)